MTSVATSPHQRMKNIFAKNFIKNNSDNIIFDKIIEGVEKVS